MNTLKLTLILGFVAALSAAVLAGTYQVTKGPIAAQEKQVEEEAVRKIFFDANRFERAEAVKVGDAKYYKVFMKGDGKIPSFFASKGSGVGYNSSVPIQLLVGFTNPAAGEVIMPDGRKYTGPMVCAGWFDVKSEETPGLGEKAKDSKAPYTLAQLATGTAPEKEDPDKRTAFQAQFEGKLPAKMVAKDTIEIITGATYTTRGIIKAVQDAESKLIAAQAASSE